MKKITLLILIFLGADMYAQGTRLLRQPTISETDIVFVYANDLWKVPRKGGNAIRLSSNEGYESLPHFSPDGEYIAFSGQYDGNTDVYVIPSQGGEPLRLTWHPGGDFVQGWTPDGKVLFRSGRQGRPTQTSKFYTVSMQGELPEVVDIPRAAFGEFSEDGSQLAYVPITFWDPEWRNYRGGQAMPIWIVDMETKDLIRTPQPTKERHLDPVWFDKEVYYLSERDYASNIWSFNPATREEKQHTFHKQFDVKSLDSGPGGIVYEQGGYLHLLNPDAGTTSQLNITVKGDMNFSRIRWETVSGNDLRNPSLSPSGKRALFEYRGEIISIPKENGSMRNLSNSPGVADRSPVWSAKGDKIAWFSDAGGEYSLVVSDQYGQRKKTYSLPDPTFYFQPDWSPDGSRIAYSDTHYNIWVIDLNTGMTKKIATDRYAHPNRTMNPVWAPDSKWLVYPKQLDSHFKAIFAYNIITEATIQLTDGMADAISPVWEEDGNYLYFLASTDYGLQSGWLDMSSLEIPISRGLYYFVLSDTGTAPDAPKSDEEEVKGEKDQPKDKNKRSEAENGVKKEINIVIDPSRLQERIGAANNVLANYVAAYKGPDNSLFLLEGFPDKNTFTVHKLDIEKMKTEEFVSDVNQISVAADRKSMLVQQNGSWRIISTTGKTDNGDGKLDTGVKIKVDPQAEYHQIFKEGWRYMRDFLYVDNVHGAPWDTIYQWYSPWIDHVRHRTDLNYVVDIMSGEVSVGHSYVSGGDFPDLDRIPIGLLGCDFKVEKELYKFSKIYTGEQWNPDLRAPLAYPGINVKEGDYLLAVNGQQLTSKINPYSLFEQTADQVTSVTIGSKADKSDARKVLVKPVRTENSLRTFDWIEGNRRKVSELSNGKLAYVYVPNTSGRGFEYFNRYYFSQQDKKGVIIDERNNGGGYAADYMIDIMDRELFGYFNSKTADNRPWTTPMAGIWGPKVMLINERAGSGGDLLPYMFKAKNIGPLIGTRTWGGLVGTWDTPRFIDGGRMVAPRGGFYDLNAQWAVEGQGIPPDIEVIQEPKLVLLGKDPQLEKGVEEAMRLLRQKEFQLKAEPAPPIRWRRPEGFVKE
ncbi:MAG: PDZ domain-containing protein [Eudoraea sp.]|nr:PDZ domain-containing protein [Eudoraea sp.]